MTKDSYGNYVKVEDIKQQDGFNGISPIEFKSNGDNLENYRIYGNTVNGESVGDLITEGEHSGEYQVPVTIEGKNLLSQLPSSRENKGIIFTNENNYIHIEGTSTGEYAQTTGVMLSLSEGTYYASFVCSNEIDKSKIFGVIRHYDNSDITNVFSNGSKFTISEPETVRIIIGVIYANSTVNTNLYFQIEKNFIKTSYEPYHAPVTTNLYLPEQIKMVGDEAEYIDYGEQKLHRVRKNLLPNTAMSRIGNGVTFTVNSDGSVTCDGTATAVTFFTIPMTINQGTYTVSGAPAGCNFETPYVTIRLRVQSGGSDVPPFNNNDFGTGVTISSDKNSNNDYLYKIHVPKGYTCNNLTFYPMIRKADIEDDTYEPYIENNELDVTLPTLPTLSGTNTLSVNTNIKPSKVWGGLNDPRDILYVKDKLGNVLFSKYYEIEDEPPLTYKAKKAGTLKDYRIYGNTVDGESVGDRTGNLWGINGTVAFSNDVSVKSKDSEFIIQSSGINGTVSAKSPQYQNKFKLHLTAGTYTYSYRYNGTSVGIVMSVYTIEGEALNSNFTLLNDTDIYIGFYIPPNTTCNQRWMFMLNTGSTPLPYEPYGYKVPVTVSNGTDTLTTPIYLPEQIRKVGDKAEYIDFEEQKMVKKSKTITFTNSNGWVTESNNNFYTDLPLDGALVLNYVIENSMNIPSVYVTLIDTIAAGADANIWVSSTGRLNVYLTTIDHTLEALGQLFENTPLTITYELANMNELDITLPAMPTFSGTNTLSVETEVQPSDIYLKGKIEKKPKIYYKIYYYSQDGQTLLYTESVLKGSNGMYSGTPTKMADPQYTYTFAGWSSSTGQTAATPEVRNNIQNDKNVYAAFSQTLNTYTVYFYNESDTPIETVQNVPYGGTATYTGATPTKQGYSFTGWSPLPTNITADTSCYAQFVDEDMYESISDTWSEIIANIGNGTYSTKYQVGDTKKIDLGTEGEVTMTIVGIDTDDLADNSGKAPITWISKQLLKTSHRMNPEKQSGTSGTGALGGWEACEMRSYLINTIKPLLPSEVRNALKTVKKYTKIYDVSGTPVNSVVTTDDVWIPSFKEVFGTSVETRGPTYSTVFPDNASRIKSKVGSNAAWWWLRSAYYDYSFYRVYTNGSLGSYYAYDTGDVALGFCT